jgi:phage-related minor tail protein
MSFDELQTSFRKTEGKLYSRLAEFNQFSVKLTKASNNTSYSSSRTDTVQQDAGYWQSEFDRRHSDITSLHSHLSDITTRLHNLASSATLTDIQRNFVRRADTVLQEVHRENIRNAQTCSNTLTRLRLFQGSDDHASIEEGKGTQALLREESHLKSSISVVDESIDMASNSYASLVRQREILGFGLHKLTMLGEKFPQIGQVMGRISRYKQRDMIVIAIVIAVCLFMIFLYMINKR